MQIAPKSALPLLLSVFMAAWPDATYAQQKFPIKPVRFVTGATPGGTPDILARLIGQKLSEIWGQPVVVENRPGGAGILAAVLVAKSTPDGYTLLQTAPTIAIRPALMANLPFDALKDFAGVSEVGFSNTVVVVSPTLGVRSVKELVAYAAARPGKMFHATGAVGGVEHLIAERFKFATGIKAQHVSYKGTAESLIETAAGRSQFTATGQTAAQPFIQDGKLVALVQVAPGLPGVPLAAEVVPQWTQMGRQAILAPAGTPLAIRQQISKEVARVLGLPEIRERLNAVGFRITPSTPEEHERNLRADIAAFAKVVKDIGLKPN